eukprot:GHRR01018717.1.p1 GENE.GHRR01018717.1~~GHRR01018717.1.p1  ORF type:complete len:321 (+),score=66.46 GHRR01018717.1:1528-2490(+)
MDEAFVETAQALLTGLDTALSRQWREEDRAWRQEDLCWRDKEQKYNDLQHQFLAEQQRWREEDIQQRNLDNARILWARVVEKNRRDVEEKTEMLRAISTLAALISGFALTAFLQFDWSPDYVDTAGAALPLFSATMALTVGLETICVIICSLMLVSVIKTGQSYMSEEEEAVFMDKCRKFIANYRMGDRPPSPDRSFTMHWAQRCENSWRRAFMLFGMGIPCLFANLSVAAWIKFDTSRPAAVLTTVIMGLSLAAMVHFHRKWTAHILETERTEVNAGRMHIAPQGLPFDWHLRSSIHPRAVSQLQAIAVSYNGLAAEQV